jgi:alanine dehydrogenase
LPFILELVNKGPHQALIENSHLQKGLNIYQGHLTHPEVAKALNMAYVPVVSILVG